MHKLRGLVLLAQLGPHFARRDLRQQAYNYLRGLLAQLERKNGWQLAEQAGKATPDGFQRLLGPARWSADAVRDELIRYAQQHLLVQGEGGTLIVDETGLLKKGQHSVGLPVQRDSGAD